MCGEPTVAIIEDEEIDGSLLIPNMVAVFKTGKCVIKGDFQAYEIVGEIPETKIQVEGNANIGEGGVSLKGFLSVKGSFTGPVNYIWGLRTGKFAQGKKKVKKKHKDRWKEWKEIEPYSPG